MPLASFLLLALLLPGTPDRAQPAQTSVAAPATGQADSSALQAARSAPDGAIIASDDDAICYKIRAYIFKRDDDHAPELVRSTTCGPRAPHTKNADWPKARLVPAN